LGHGVTFEALRHTVWAGQWGIISALVLAMKQMANFKKSSPKAAKGFHATMFSG
jgi:hypothetical protein